MRSRRRSAARAPGSQVAIPTLLAEARRGPKGPYATCSCCSAISDATGRAGVPPAVTITYIPMRPDPAARVYTLTRRFTAARYAGKGSVEGDDSAPPFNSVRLLQIERCIKQKPMAGTALRLRDEE